MQEFTTDEKQLLDELLMRYPTGAGYAKGNIPQDVEAIAGPLIELGAVEYVELEHPDTGEPVESLRLSPAMYALFHRAAAAKAEEN